MLFYVCVVICMIGLAILTPQEVNQLAQLVHEEQEYYKEIGIFVRRIDSCSISAPFIARRLTMVETLPKIVNSFEKMTLINYSKDPQTLFQKFKIGIMKSLGKIYYILSLKNNDKAHLFVIELIDGMVYLYQSFMSRYNIGDVVGDKQKKYHLKNFYNTLKIFSRMIKKKVKLLLSLYFFIKIAKK